MTSSIDANVTYLRTEQATAQTQEVESESPPESFANYIREIADASTVDASWQWLLLGAMRHADAEAGVIHLIEDAAARPHLLRLARVGIAYGGDAAPSPFPARSLECPETGKADLACHAALEGRIIHLDGHNALAPFDRTTDFLASLGSQVTSALAIPISNDAGETIAVLSVYREASDVEYRRFDDAARERVTALAASARSTLRAHRRKAEQREFYRALVRMMIAAINAKSPYTGAHCQRVPVIYDLLARAACASEDGPFADFELDEDGLEELAIAAWLHDCGKVATPEHVVDKATRLETVHDRIHEILARFEIVKREVEIDCLKHIIRRPDQAERLRAEMYERIGALDDDLAFLIRANRGETSMTDKMLKRVEGIAAHAWRDHEGITRPLLSEDEVANLSIRIGTLTPAERRIINRHVEVSIEMLQELPFPAELARVTEIAGEHHEKMNGTGYPRGLTGEQMSIPSRMLVIADIFEALTAGDRPYKRGKTLSEALTIMARMRDSEEIDAEIFDLFLRSRVWRDYAETHMPTELRDPVDIDLLIDPPASEQDETENRAETA